MKSKSNVKQGARPLKRAGQKQLLNLLFMQVIKGRFKMRPWPRTCKILLLTDQIPLWQISGHPHMVSLNQPPSPARRCAGAAARKIYSISSGLNHSMNQFMAGDANQQNIPGDCKL